MKWFEEQIEQNFEQMVAWRRYLHQNPELSNQESKTAAFVADLLRGWGLNVRTNVGGNGIVATLNGSEPGVTVALRADMDALPIQDLKTCDYASKVPGVMHACGHDGHTTSLLAVAKVLSENQDRWKGTIVFLFQHAEEVTPGGAKFMIEDGALEGVQAVYGIHLWSKFPTGTAFSLRGPIMAAADEFIIDITGKGGHGGLPHQTIDSILIGSQIVTALQTIVSRRINPIQPSVISIGTFQAGNSFNVIAEKCLLKGTVRTFDETVRMDTRKMLLETVEGISNLYGAQVDTQYKMGYPPLINHDSEVGRFEKVARELFGSTNVVESEPMMAAEDFAYYLQKVPGCFMFVGAGNADKGATYSHHHPMFDFDEEAMKNSAKLYFTMALDRIAEG